MEEKFSEYIEIWCPSENGEAVEFKTGKKLKRIAVLVNGQPLFLEKDVYMERGHITKKEIKYFTDKLNNK